MLENLVKSFPKLELKSFKLVLSQVFERYQQFNEKVKKLVEIEDKKKKLNFENNTDNLELESQHTKSRILASRLEVLFKQDDQKAKHREAYEKRLLDVETSYKLE